MILQDQMTVWITSRFSDLVDGEPQLFYTNLKNLFANVQYLSNSLESKIYGEISNQTIEIRTDTIPPIQIGDCIYLEKPQKESVVVIAGKAHDSYPKGNYIVQSIKPAYVGGNHIQNPTLITARKATP